LVYEERLRSMRTLLDELEGLEADAGIRVAGRFRGRERLMFVNRHSGKYVVWITPKGGPRKSGGAFRTFNEASRVRRFLRETVSEPIEAYLY
jgi:hypothetical protein